MEGLDRILKAHPFFASLAEPYLTLVSGCAKNLKFEADQYLICEGEEADAFYLVRKGRVGITITVPGRGALMIHTVTEGELAGVSWLVPPYRWTYDAKALEPTLALSIDAKCLRQKCEMDHDLGYDMMKRFLPVLVERLHSARLQMLDVYGAHA